MKAVCFRRAAAPSARHSLALLLLVLLGTGAGLWPRAGLAAQFTLAPTRVHLAAGQVAQTLVLGNEEAREVSFELSFQRWRMDEHAQWLLEPSDDLILHPQIVTVPGNGKAVIRVGTLRTQLAQEQAYRIQMQELPGERDTQGAAVAMLTRISVPVFVQGAKPELALTLSGKWPLSCVNPTVLATWATVPGSANASTPGCPHLPRVSPVLFHHW